MVPWQAVRFERLLLQWEPLDACVLIVAAPKKAPPEFKLPRWNWQAVYAIRAALFIP
jgi:hypothetical protein